jgi:PAS domain S-box-containing protein
MAMTQDITERKHVELALRDSEARLRAFLDNTPALVFIHDEAGRYVYLNKAVQEFVKTPASELLGKTLFDRLPADIAQPLRENFLKVIHGGTAQEFEETVPAPDGSLRHQIVVKFPMEESAGRKLLAGVAIDITERKQAEEKLRASEARLSRAQEIAHLGYISKNPNSDLLEWSDEVFRILGHEPQAFQPTREALVKAVHPDDAGLLADALMDLSVHQKPIDLKHRIVRPDGSVRWVHVLMEPVWDNDGRVVRYDGTFLDISDLIRFEEELRESEALKSAILESALDAIITMDSEGRILEFNPAAETTFGYKREEIIGRSLANALIPPGFREMHIRAYENCLEKGFSDKLNQRLEVSAMRANGEEFPVEVAIHRISRHDQETFTGFVRDISERKRAEAELRASQAQLQRAHDELEQRVHERTQELEETNRALNTEIAERQIAMGALRDIVGQLEIAKEEAERANSAKSEFLSRMSHELRTPMNSIMGFAQIMEMTAPEGRQAHRINQILKAGQHLLHLINEVLDLSRVESGRLSLMPEPVSVGAAIDTAVDLIRPLCQQRDVTVIHDAGRCEKIFVTADHQRLAQVLLNLLGNATKYNRHGGTIQIVCDSSKPGWIRLSVRDSGVGIAAADLPRLFVPFERLSATAGSVEGTGLGLALSKRLVEAMGGSMGVESAVGLGSTFWLELPAAGAPTSISEDPIDEHSMDFGGVPATILYIEDSATNYQVLEDLLSVHENLHLVGASDGRSGLEMAVQTQPALILLDLHLPDMHGEEVLQHLKEELTTSTTPVIVVSADATPTQIHRLLEGGAVEYLTKPLDVRRLLGVMAKVLGRR